jgi:Ca2+-binding RTX toxin-like protein
MVGDMGNDTYIVDNESDYVSEYIEGLFGGTDTIKSSVSYVIDYYNYVENLTLTGTLAINATGNQLNNTIVGNAAANIIDGGAGADTMSGGAGNDTYIVEDSSDKVIEAATAGTDTVVSSVDYTLGLNLENLTLVGTGAINATGNSAANLIEGNIAANILNGGLGIDTMKGGLGNDTYIVDSVSDLVIEDSALITEIDTVHSSVSYSLNANLENIKLLGTAAINGTGNVLNNYLLGNTGINTLSDTLGGNDIYQGLVGADTLTDTVATGNNVFDGGKDNDIITGGAGRDLFIGGLGVDTITTGTGYDVISFNKGDGQDTINASTGADNTLSLGGNFAFSDLSLTKSTNDLILKMGTTDQITLKDWYLSGSTNKSVVSLQVIAEAIQGFSLGSADVLRNNKVETFNFTNLVAAFDAAGATANWQLTDARLTTHLQAGSDSTAIGGDLAYQYGKNSNLSGMGLLNAQNVIASASFGQTAQTLNNPTVWQAEMVKLA